MAESFSIEIGWMVVEATGPIGMIGVITFVAVLLLLPVLKSWLRKRIK